MSLVRLYGRRSVVFSDSKNVYRSQNGVLDVPQALVPRAIEQGFSKNVPADMQDPAEDVAPVVEPPTTTATQTIPLPPEHPQSTTDRVQEARNAERATSAAQQTTAAAPAQASAEQGARGTPRPGGRRPAS